MSISAGTDPPSLGLSPGPRPNRPPASPEAAAGPRPRNTAARRAHLPRVRPPAGFAAGSCSLFRERLVSETVVSLISSPGPRALAARSRQSRATCSAGWRLPASPAAPRTRGRITGACKKQPLEAVCRVASLHADKPCAGACVRSAHRASSGLGAAVFGS